MRFSECVIDGEPVTVSLPETGLEALFWFLEFACAKETVSSARAEMTPPQSCEYVITLGATAEHCRRVEAYLRGQICRIDACIRRVTVVPEKSIVR